MSGKDVIGIAKTGSGKTIAFLLPMLRHILDQPALEEDDGPIGEWLGESSGHCKIIMQTATNFKMSQISNVINSPFHS